jgi:hypothetical protein
MKSRKCGNARALGLLGIGGVTVLLASSPLLASPTLTNLAPAAPSNLQVQGGFCGASASWTDNSSIESGFKVYARRAGGAWWVAATVGPNVTSTSFSIGATDDYEFQVRAYRIILGSTFHSAPSNIDAAWVPCPH